MEINEVRISTDQDFKHFQNLIWDDKGWKTTYSKNQLIVNTKWTSESRIKMIKVYIFTNCCFSPQI